MAENSPSSLDVDTRDRSQSNSTTKSNATIESNRSATSLSSNTTNNPKRRGLLAKIGTGFQSVIERFSRTHTSLTEMEIRMLIAMTSFTREEVLQWHEKFLADCPNGYMTRKQFISMYKTLCPRSDSERFARHIFRAFDRDKSNRVDFHEFLVGLSMTLPTSTVQTKLEWIFRVFDIDGNEVIESIVRFNQSLQGETSNTVIEQLIISAKKSMMNIFNNVNDHRHDQLTLQQFVQGCLKDEFISQLLAPTNTTPTMNTTINTQNSTDDTLINTT